MHSVISGCRSCGSPDIETFLSLGVTPLADALVKEEDLGKPEHRAPLTVAFCPRCALVQILETVPPEILFCQDYPYYSSVSEMLMRHTGENAERLIASRRLNGGSLVIELASNDGYMLKNFAAEGIPVLGIDPADGPASVAQKAGIPTLCTFFTRDLAEQLRAEGKRADVVIANNVMAHVPDLNGFVGGIATLLKDDGVLVTESPYVKDLIDHTEFDTIYHEHLNYYSVSSLSALFKRHGLSLNHVEHYPIHGGSLRLFAGRRDEPSAEVRRYLRGEQQAGLTTLEYYQDFSRKVLGIKRDLLDLLGGLKREGKRIAAYGAAAKGSTLVNFIGVDRSLVDYVVDRSAYKQGKYMPGVHLPIRPTEALLEDQPDHVLMLAWNFKDEILRQQAEYRARGGKFIIPVPTPVVV